MRSLLLAAIAVVLPASLIQAQEQPPQAPPVTHIVAVVKFCKVEAPTECREIEIVPDAGREPASVMECARGVSMAAAEFTFEGERWFTKGGSCKEITSDFKTWQQAKKATP
jgi:hypothetical protein